MQNLTPLVYGIKSQEAKLLQVVYEGANYNNEIMFTSQEKPQLTEQDCWTNTFTVMLLLLRFFNEQFLVRHT